MKVGICLPYSEPGITRETLVDWCRAIEDSPLSSVSSGFPARTRWRCGR